MVLRLPQHSPDSSLTQPGLLQGVVEATSQLLTRRDYTQAIDSALATLGHVTGVDRVYIFALHPHPETGETVASQRFEWVRDSIPPQIHNPELQNCTFIDNALQRWYNVLHSGRSISTLVANLPSDERERLVLQDVQSLLIVPIQIDGELWGCIGFDDCTQERQWSLDEEAALQMMATSLGGAIARHQTEMALQQSESRLQNIAANIPGLIYQLLRRADGTKQVLYASSGCRELLELEPDQVIEQCSLVWDLCHPDDREGFRHSADYSAATLRPWNWEGRMITPSGRLKWVQGVARPTLHSNGDLLWDGVLVDVSDRRQMDEARRQSEARYRAMLDATPDLMFRLNREGCYLDFKPTSTATIPPEGIVGRYLHDVLSPAIADLCLSVIHRTLDTGELQTCDYQLAEPMGLRDYEARVVVSGRDEVLWIAQDVTQRKQQERALQASEARHRALVNAIPDLLFRIHRDGTYLDCKLDGNHVTLVPVQDLLGKTVYEVLPPDLAQQRMAYIHQALDTGEPQDFEYQLTLEGGTRASQLYQQISPQLGALPPTTTYVRDYEARIVVSGEDEVLAIVRDITERKLAEMALRQSEEKFARAFQASPNPLTLSTLIDGYILDVNDSFLQVSGYQRSEVIGQRVYDLQLWVDPASRTTIVQRMQQDGMVRNLECQFRMKNNSIRTTLFSAEVVDIGNQPCMLSMVVDITERQQAEQQLWAAAERDRLVRDIALRIRESLDLQQILDTTVAEVRQCLQVDRVYIGHHDPAGLARVMAESVAPHCPRLLGTIFDDPGYLQEIYALFSGGDIRVVNDTQQERSPRLQAFYQDYQIQAGIVAPIMLDHQLFGVLGAHQCSHSRTWEPYEIDLLKQLATHLAIAIQQAHLYQQVQDLNTGLEQQVVDRTAELQQRMEELQELGQLKDEFLNAFSHDLRTPVMGISLVINNLLNQPGETLSINRSIFERMAQSTQHQLQLINSLLQAHSSETRGVILNYELVQLSLLTQVIVEEVEPLVLKSRASLANQVPSDLPLVNADPVQLRRVFENLITNALHHNPPGVHLMLTAAVEADLIRFKLIDDGIGMAPDIRDSIFERYSRGRSSRHSAGIGLGLYLCRQIITAHGGQIGVESVLGEGSTFWFTLPLAIASGTNSTSEAMVDA